MNNTKTSVVVVGMENSVAGACPGAEFDATRMYNMFKKYDENAVLLLNKSATTENFIKSVSEATKSDLAIIYYSGHGGSEKIKKNAPEEADGKDEFICLWDDFFMDDDIWAMISQSKGRVVLLFDCCHSETMFRTPCITFGAVNVPRGSSVNMLCWSGCPDDSVSWGSPSGGQFTNTLLKYFDENLTYDQIWAKMKADKNLQNYEAVRQTKLGQDFGNKLIFR